MPPFASQKTAFHNTLAYSALSYMQPQPKQIMQIFTADTPYGTRKRYINGTCFKINNIMEQTTIENVYRAWREMKKQTVRESTLATYVSNAEKHILPAFGAMRQIDDAHMQAFVMKLADGGLSTHTIKDILLVLKMMMAYGRKKGLTDWREWDIHMPKDDGRHELTVLTHAEQRTLMAHLRRHISFRSLGLYICLCTGMRIGEICALKWDDIDTRTRVIRIRRTIERIYVYEDGRKRTKVVIGRPKTASSQREIPISNELARIIKPFTRLACPGSYVLSNDTKPIEPRIYRSYYQKIMKTLGLPPMKFHGLRHTFATRCIESNFDYKTVSSILGHSNISTTLNLYVHPDISQKRRCIDNMMKTVMGKSGGNKD